MKDAGYGGGITGMLAAHNVAGNDDVAKVVQKQLQAVGINLDLNIQDVTVWIQLMQSQKHTIGVHSWNGKYDPIVNFNLSLGPGGTYDSEGARWRSLAAGGTPDNLVATMDDLLHRANAEFDADKRKQLAAQIQTASVDLGLCVPVIGWPQAHGYAKNVNNLFVEPEAYATNNSTIWLG
jgi:ABC-type transport system substrate-binding protein